MKIEEESKNKNEKSKEHICFFHIKKGHLLRVFIQKEIILYPSFFSHYFFDSLGR